MHRASFKIGIASLLGLALCVTQHVSGQTTPVTGQPARRQDFGPQPYPQQQPTTGRAPQAKLGLPTTNPQTAQNAIPVGPPPAPPGFDLTPALIAHRDRVLDHWENRSKKIRTYTCEFSRWEYDAVFGPKNPNTPKTKSVGEIRYAAPDKGEFRVDAIGEYQAPLTQGQQPKYPMQDVRHSEHWVCNGTSVFELNAQQKQLIETRLPPEMQGNQIADGPLPFMFGSTKEKMNARYWIREEVGAKGVYTLEILPKRRSDAIDFSRVRLHIDEQDFLPSAMQIFPPNYHPRKNWSRTVYQFTKRKPNDPIDLGQQFFKRFISPATPLGWKKVVTSFGQAPPVQVSDTPSAKSARRPLPPTK